MALTSEAFASDALQQIVNQRVKGIESRPKYDLENSFGFEGYIPFQAFRYQYGFDEETREEGHTLRIDIKSFNELKTFHPSRRISKKLLSLSEAEVLNQARYDAYMSIVQQLIYFRMVKLLNGREKDLNRSVEQSSKFLGLPKVNIKDLISELSRLHKVTAEGSALKAQARAFEKMELKEIDAAAEHLIQFVPRLGEGIGKLPQESEVLSLERKRLELDLERINREVSWGDDRKLLSHVDIRRNTDRDETSFRINFNIPFFRFDRENFAREKVLHRLKEQDYIRDHSKVKSELERKLYSVQALATQTQSTLDRFAKTKKMIQELRKVKDLELKQALSEFGFEIEREILVNTLKFYSEYLEYLLEAGLFARFNDVNFLNPSWIGNGAES